MRPPAALPVRAQEQGIAAATEARERPARIEEVALLPASEVGAADLRDGHTHRPDSSHARDQVGAVAAVIGCAALQDQHVAVLEADGVLSREARMGWVAVGAAAWRERFAAAAAA